MSAATLPSETTGAQATKLRGIASTMRAAAQSFRSLTADGQALESFPAFAGCPAVDSLGAAVTIDHAAIAWLLARGFTITSGGAA